MERGFSISNRQRKVPRLVSVSYRVPRPSCWFAVEEREGKLSTTKYLGDNDLVFAKGIYPYSYMENRFKFDETKLPSIESFYNTLNDEPLSVEDYECAQNI